MKNGLNLKNIQESMQRGVSLNSTKEDLLKEINQNLKTLTQDDLIKDPELKEDIKKFSMEVFVNGSVDVIEKMISGSDVICMTTVNSGGKQKIVGLGLGKTLTIDWKKVLYCFVLGVDKDMRNLHIGSMIHKKRIEISNPDIIAVSTKSSEIVQNLINMENVGFETFPKIDKPTPVEVQNLTKTIFEKMGSSIQSFVPEKMTRENYVPQDPTGLGVGEHEILKRLDNNPLSAVVLVSIKKDLMENVLQKDNIQK